MKRVQDNHLGKLVCCDRGSVSGVSACHLSMTKSTLLKLKRERHPVSLPFFFELVNQKLPQLDPSFAQQAAQQP
jgi:hypothetical protein